MTKRNNTIWWIPLLLAAILMISGCRATPDDLTGAWQASWFNEELGGNVTLIYRFSPDGKLLVEGDDFSLPFASYSAAAGLLTLTGDDDSQSEFSYSVEGDSLILYYTDGSVYLTLQRIQ